MFRMFAQFDLVTGVIFSVVESAVEIVGDDIVEVFDKSAIGKKWNGVSIVDVPHVPRYKIFEKPRFIVALGVDVYFAIKNAEGTPFEFYRYVLDNSPHVDMNIPEFRDMVVALRDGGLINDEKLALLLVQE